MTLLYIFLLILVAIIAMVFSYYVGLRAVGIKASLVNAFKLTAVLLVLQSLATLLSHLLGDSPLIIVVWLVWLIGAFIVWHKLLNHYYQANIGKSLGAYIIAGVIAVILSVIVAIAATGLVQPFKIEGNVMSPTLRHGDTVLTYKWGKELEANKVVVYNHETNGIGTKAIGRILHTPGQTVSIKTGYVDVNGTLADPADYTLKEGEYYIVGDNREDTLPRIVKAEDIVAVVGPTILEAK